MSYDIYQKLIEREREHCLSYEEMLNDSHSYLAEIETLYGSGHPDVIETKELQKDLATKIAECGDLIHRLKERCPLPF